MAPDPDDEAIVQLYVERGARKYEGLLPGPALVYFGVSLGNSFLAGKSHHGVLDMLRHSGAPRRIPEPEPTGEPPLLTEEQERMLDELPIKPEQRRTIRALFASDLIERAAERAARQIDWFEDQVDPATFDLFRDAIGRAGIIVSWHSSPGGADRDACDRSLARWVDLAFARLFADVMVELAKPGDLQDRRPFLRGVRVFRAAFSRLLPDDRAIFTTYCRDDEGFVPVAARRNVTPEDERVRYEGFVERLAAAVEEETPKVQAHGTLAELQEELARLAAWVGQRGERAVH